MYQVTKHWRSLLGARRLQDSPEGLGPSSSLGAGSILASQKAPETLLGAPAPFQSDCRWVCTAPGYMGWEEHIPDSWVWIMGENCTGNSLELMQFLGEASGFVALTESRRKSQCPEMRVAEVATCRLLGGQVSWRILAVHFKILKDLFGAQNTAASLHC